MRRNRRASERTQTGTNTIAKAKILLVTLLACAIGLLGLDATSVSALAAEGSVTIVREGNDGARYDAYPVLFADITGEGSGSHFSWPSDTVRDAVLAAIDAEGYGTWLQERHPGEDQHDLPQNAAAYLSLLLSSSEQTLPQGSYPETTGKGSASGRIARALSRSEELYPLEAHAGDPFAGEQGLWLFVSAVDGEEDHQEREEHGEGTEALWAVLGPEQVTIAEKVGRPTLTKQVKNAEGSWTSLSGIQAGETRVFRLTATLPNNISKYDHYLLRFEDHLSEGLALAAEPDDSPDSPVQVRLDDRLVVADGTHLVVRHADKELSVEFSDLRDEWWDDAGVSADTVVTVEYPVRITDAATCSSSGNTNEARIIYTNDPIHLSSASSPTVSATVMTWQLRMIKTAGEGEGPLEGARFTVTKKGSSEIRGDTAFVQQDGSLGKKAHEFVTGPDGQTEVKGLDDGTYLVTEVEAPDGYRKMRGHIELVVTSEFDETSRLRTQLEAKATSKSAQLGKVLSDEGLVELIVENKTVSPTGPEDVDPKDPTSPERLAQTGVGPAALVFLSLGVIVLLASRSRGTPG